MLLLFAPAVLGASPLKLKPAPKDVPAERKGPAHVKAPTTEDDVERDAAAAKKRDELIADLKTIIPKIPDGEKKADLYFQLAELWWEKARYVYLRENKEYDDAYAKWMEKREGAEPKVDTHVSDGHRREALRIYQIILKNYPSYERKDEVLFVVAYNLYEAGQKQEAIQNYNTLIKQYPQSRFVPDAYVQMGEHFFQANDLTRARAAFEKAASFKLPKLYPFALYKLAWCDYNAGEYQGAIDKFKEVIAYSEGGSKDRIQLKNEALKDIVLAYAQIDAIDSASAYLHEKGGTAALDYVNKLAATYFDSGKFDEAIRVYKMLESEAPGHVRAPAWQQKVLLAYDKLNKRDKVVQEMKRLVADYGPSSPWAKANAEQKGAIAEANDLAESALRELVQDYHQEAIKTKSVATYKLARDIYRQYLETFPGSETAYSMRFFYAEILYALEEWDEAAAQYDKVVDADRKGSYAQKAAYDAILALEKSVDIAKGKLKKRELAESQKIDERKAKGQVEQSRVKLQTVTKEIPEEAIPDNEQRLIAACEKYLNVAPGSKDEIVIRYKAAFVYYDHRHFVEAAKRFGDIILEWPTDAWSQKAADLSLDILNTKEEWLALSDLAHKFLQNKKLTPPGSKFEKEVAQIGEGAKFKYVIQLYEEKKDYALAAKEFREFVARYPKSEHAPKALYNAMVIADKADRLDVEIAAGEQLVEQYPKAEDEIVHLTIPSLAAACERAARYTDAIKWYEDAQSRWPDDPKAADWLFNAAIWREGLSDDAGALADWQKYVKQYSSRPDVAKIAFNVGLIVERQKDPKKTADYWYSFQQQYAQQATPGQLLLARYKQGLALRELKTSEAPIVMGEVAQRFAKLPDAEKATPPVVDAAAHARFMGIDSAFNDFLGIHFNYTRQGDLVYVLKIKNARMNKLLAQYGEVIAVGSPKWSEAAFERIGEAYRNFNKGLLEAPMPRGLDPEQQELYRSTLESQALPLEDKATEAFTKSIEVSQKSGVYSDWVIKAQDFMREYQPDAYGEIHKPSLVDSELSRSVAPDVVAAGSGGGQ
ncbi:MAG: tetratricopeptide repeat protein [Myxococcales bacterium]|nr:tetratricopeptide repeat protein [Myxococcales bacterium]